MTHRVTSDSKAGRSLVSKGAKESERIGMSRDQMEWNRRLEERKQRRKERRDERRLNAGDVDHGADHGI